MLVLSRKLGEEIVIGENIRLTVVAIRGNYIRLGFKAPRDVSIVREELCHRAEEADALAVRPATLERGP
jgi:carbon storage regulator